MGVLLPFISGILNYSKYNIVEAIGAVLFFIACFTLVLAGNDWIWNERKKIFSATNNSFIKKGLPWLISILYSIVASNILVLAWLKISNDPFNKTNWITFTVICTLLIAAFNVVNEIFFYRKESDEEYGHPKSAVPEEPDDKTILLRNDLDPHFIFNSLTTLSHLIMNEAPKAHVFNSKLSSVYKYFLLNKERELISLTQELEFIEDYFYLLQIRYDNKIQMKVVPSDLDEKTLVSPCALQILVENALKHNEYTENDPLEIKISINKHFLKVTNNIKPKPYLVNSTRIGLNNLNSRYKLICNKNIEIENSADQFIVKLPLIRN